MKIIGEKIILRDMQFADLEALSYWLNPIHKWHQFNGPYYSPAPLEKIPEKIAVYAAEISRGELPELRKYLIIAKKETNEIMGMVNWYWISQETLWMALGILIYDDNNWRGGYGTEALCMWRDYLFQNDPKLVRLDLRTWSGNVGMMNLAEKVGFTKEAVFRKARIVNGKYYDGLGYGILREEWEQQK
ncbi:MAG: GNAT family N-acetyltransferase [Anaerolineaceae bacterium]|nr:GNAT family N-acetyltransferase [Anaerolineaceae bacterium]